MRNFNQRIYPCLLLCVSLCGLAGCELPDQISPAASLSDSDRLQLNVLMVLNANAEQATSTQERNMAYEEFLTRSSSFVAAHPDQTNVWVMRAMAAAELGRLREGWEAGQRLKAMGMLHSMDPTVEKALAELELKGWLGQEPKFPQAAERWTNSLGQVFSPVPGTRVLFCIWDTRVQDFEKFVADTGYDATQGMLSLGNGGWQRQGDTWKSPGFLQGPTCPVCGVSWEDAHAFCTWLTAREQAMGLLRQDQSYRLPTDAEWSTAVGAPDSGAHRGLETVERDSTVRSVAIPAARKAMLRSLPVGGFISNVYPWGNQYPPPPGAGNYAGTEAPVGDWPITNPTIPGYNDGFPQTSPVGTFTANQYGLYDMGGNVWQICEDFYVAEMNTDAVRRHYPAANFDGGGEQYHVLRGASWDNAEDFWLLAGYRDKILPDGRQGNVGFRCVLVLGGTPE